MAATIDARRIAVWEAMAEHFLDTEARHYLPATALVCVEAGFSVEAARAAWEREVEPALIVNLFAVAGEWAMWDRDWLVARIERSRARWTNRNGLACRLREHFHLDGGGRARWHAIGTWMEILLATAPSNRAALTADMTLLGEIAFYAPGFLAHQRDAIAVARERLVALYPEPFHRVMSPTFLDEEEALFDARMRDVLKQRKATPFR